MKKDKWEKRSRAFFTFNFTQWREGPLLSGLFGLLFHSVHLNGKTEGMEARNEPNKKKRGNKPPISHILVVYWCCVLLFPLFSFRLQWMKEEKEAWSERKQRERETTQPNPGCREWAVELNEKHKERRERKKRAFFSFHYLLSFLFFALSLFIPPIYGTSQSGVFFGGVLWSFCFKLNTMDWENEVSEGSVV